MYMKKFKTVLPTSSLPNGVIPYGISEHNVLFLIPMKK